MIMQQYILYLPYSYHVFSTQLLPQDSLRVSAVAVAVLSLKAYYKISPTPQELNLVDPAFAF